MIRRALVPLLIPALLATRGEALRSEQGTPPPAPAARSRSSARPLLWDALDQYARGAFDIALAQAVRVGFDPLQAEAWIAAGSRPAQDGRRVAAAICALEVSAARPFLLPRLATWARNLMNRGEPGPDEALWLRTSIALAEGFGQWTFLLERAPALPTPAPARGKAAPAPGPPSLAHLRYSRQRLGDDPHVLLAEVVGAEYMTSPALVGAGSRLGRRLPGVDRLGGDADDRAILDRVGATPLLRTAADVAERLTSVDAVDAEARVRLGYIRLRLGDTDGALSSLEAVERRSIEKDLRYLARLYTGLTLDRLNRGDEAAAVYRSALEVVPNARTATVLLTSLLMRTGRLAESEAVSVSFMEAPVQVVDPWRSYLLGDYRNARNLIEQLRGLVR